LIYQPQTRQDDARIVLAFFFMKFFVFILILFAIAPVCAQTDLEKLVGAERAFAKTALDKGTRSAFLEFMSSDAVVFNPDRTVAKPFWTARPETPSALIWAPNFADVSSNGILGYTTGNWEYRAKGRDDAPGAFGNFITVWVRQPSGQYRWVVDIGIGHAKPEKYSEDFTQPRAGMGNPSSVSAAEFATSFYETAAKQGIQKAYSAFADNDVRFFREDEFPASGRGALLDRVKKYKGTFAFPKRSMFFETADMAYTNNSYTFTPENGPVERGNFLQIWKFVNGKWKIVLDIFKPIPQKAS
jgi:ketosteroid isomerase-like protein